MDNLELMMTYAAVLSVVCLATNPTSRVASPPRDGSVAFLFQRGVALLQPNAVLPRGTGAA